jgi:uncharacterized membrane protein (Fun14 family)
MSDRPSTSSNDARSPRAARSIWSSTALRIALVVAAAGAGLWIYAAATAPPPPPPVVPGVSSFSGDLPISREDAARWIDQASPAIFRFGSSFVVGFFLGWALRKFVKWTMLIAGAALVGYYFLHRAGIATIGSDDMHATVDRSLAWLRGEADSFKEFILGYVPSGASAAAGIFFGVRSK